MGYIDCDTHVLECAHTWDFFDRAEQEYRPILVNGHMRMQDLYLQWPPPVMEEWQTEVFRPGAVDLSAPDARLRYMDDLGIDVAVLFPTLWLVRTFGSPMGEAAMARSYNRWLAERTADSGGRLRWAVVVPVRTMDRALEEIQFGRAHGAVAVFLKGFTHGMSVTNPYFLPIYEKAQELDMAIAFHVAHEEESFQKDQGRFLYSGVMPVPCAFGALLQSGLCDRFPRLRWAFVEAGAAWIPYVAQEVFRHLDIRGFGANGWQEYAREAFAKHDVFVSCQMDDDLTYLSTIVGQESLVHGTDFGHLDLGSDPNGLHIIASRTDLDLVLRSNIVQSVGRRLYGIDDSFCPAPAPSIEGYAINTHQHASASPKGRAAAEAGFTTDALDIGEVEEALTRTPGSQVTLGGVD